MLVNQVLQFHFLSAHCESIIKSYEIRIPEKSPARPHPDEPRTYWSGCVRNGYTGLNRCGALPFRPLVLRYYRRLKQAKYCIQQVASCNNFPQTVKIAAMLGFTHTCRLTEKGRAPWGPGHFGQWNYGFVVDISAASA
jgi:hypothetical protein